MWGRSYRYRDLNSRIPVTSVPTICGKKSP
jgi:hypothetical protein